MAAPAHKHATFAPPPSAAPDTDGLLLCAYYVAARGFTTEAARLLPTCRELGEDKGEESLLRGLIAGEMKVERGGGVVRRPRLHAAARVGSAGRVAALVRVGARVGAVNEEGLTALMVAAWWGREAVVRELLGTAGVDAAFVGSRIAAGKVGPGHSAFSLACISARKSNNMLSEGEREAAAACARALAASPLMGPGDLGGSDGTALLWACDASLEDVVRSWLGDPRCTAAIVAQRNTDGRSAFSVACYRARDSDRKLSEGERAAATGCATLLATRHQPSDSVARSTGNSALLWACHARLTHIVAAWVASPTCTRDVLIQRGADGASPFSTACRGARDASRHLSSTERATAAQAARTIAASPHMRPGDLGEHSSTALMWASWAGLHDIVTTLLASPLCTRAVMTACSEGGESAFSAACKWAGDSKRVLSMTERADAVKCAKALAASPHLSPGDTSHCGRTALASACGAGLVDIVSVMLADARCTRTVVTQDDMKGGTAASALLKRCGAAATLTAEERRDTVACARALGGSEHVPWPIRERLKAAAVACEGTV